jgi:hypothetical protein
MPSLLELANIAKTVIEDAEAPLRTLLDEHVPALVQLGQQVEGSRLIKGSIRAEQLLPQKTRDGIATMLESLLDEFESAQQPAEPQPEPVPA